MIRTAVGVALLILIAAYGLLYVNRESFTSTIDFTTIIDLYKKITPEDTAKLELIFKAAESDYSFDNALKAKILERNELIDLLNTNYAKFDKEISSIAFKYNLSTADVYSLLIYLGLVLTDTPKTPIEQHNISQLLMITRLWTPPNYKGSAPSTAVNVASALVATSTNPLSSTPALAGLSSGSTASGSKVSTSTASSSTASVPGSASASSTINTTVRDAVRAELKLAGLIAGSSPSPTTNANFGYNTAAQQSSQACAARNWCNRCRRPQNTCQC